MVISEATHYGVGFTGNQRVIRTPLSFELLSEKYQKTPGLIADKLKATLEHVWAVLPQSAISGIVFAYDEAQNLALCD